MRWWNRPLLPRRAFQSVCLQQVWCDLNESGGLNKASFCDDVDVRDIVSTRGVLYLLDDDIDDICTMRWTCYAGNTIFRVRLLLRCLNLRLTTNECRIDVADGKGDSTGVSVAKLAILRFIFSEQDVFFLAFLCFTTDCVSGHARPTTPTYES